MDSLGYEYVAIGSGSPRALADAEERTDPRPEFSLS
jgi:hypothetical protein